MTSCLELLSFTSVRAPQCPHCRRRPLCCFTWARLLKRVFNIDLEHCAQCGGELKIIAAIEELAVIVRILTRLDLPARAPARSLELFQAA